MKSPRRGKALTALSPVQSAFQSFSETIGCPSAVNIQPSAGGQLPLRAPSAPHPHVWTFRGSNPDSVGFLPFLSTVTACAALMKSSQVRILVTSYPALANRLFRYAITYVCMNVCKAYFLPSMMLCCQTSLL